MKTFHYNTLIVEGDVATPGWFRAAFDPREVGAERHTCFLDLIHDGDGGRRRLMYSFRTAGAPRLELFDGLAESFPAARLILLHDAAGGRPASGFAVFELGRRVRYGGAIAMPGDAPQLPLGGGPSEKLYGRHRLTKEVYERRMRASGVFPDDPIEGGKTGDDVDW